MDLANKFEIIFGHSALNIYMYFFHCIERPWLGSFNKGYSRALDKMEYLMIIRDNFC